MKSYQVPLKFSQNFVKDPALIAGLLTKTNITKADIVLEIGAGNGIITNELSLKAGEVIAFEKDKDLAKRRNVDVSPSNVRLLNEDFLNLPLPKYKYKVFAN